MVCGRHGVSGEAAARLVGMESRKRQDNVHHHSSKVWIARGPANRQLLAMMQYVQLTVNGLPGQSGPLLNAVLEER